MWKVRAYEVYHGDCDGQRQTVIRWLDCPAQTKQDLENMGRNDNGERGGYKTNLRGGNRFGQ